MGGGRAVKAYEQGLETQLGYCVSDYVIGCCTGCLKEQSLSWSREDLVHAKLYVPKRDAVSNVHRKIAWLYRACNYCWELPILG